MNIDIKTGSTSDFFEHHRAIAKKIDKHKKLSSSNAVIWVEMEDLVQIIKPERRKIIHFLQKNKEVLLSDLIKFTGRTRMSVNHDIKVLSKYDLVKVSEKPNAGHGLRKVVSSTTYNKKMLLQTQL